MLSADQASKFLIYLGAIGILQFGSLAFCAHQLRGFATGQLPTFAMIRVRKRMTGPAVRHAPLITFTSAMTLLAGVVLGM